MPLRYYPRGVVVYVLRAIGGVKGDPNTVAHLVEVLKISEESRKF